MMMNILNMQNSLSSNPGLWTPFVLIPIHGVNVWQAEYLGNGGLFRARAVEELGGSGREKDTD